ncbi:MAG: hypothetical protein IIA30_15580 [Myxococcales bacterium]|nr:hypothetical protein [Myxococcales bacterium]
MGVFPKSEFRFTQGKPTAFASSEIGTRYFCPGCGCQLVFVYDSESSGSDRLPGGRVSAFHASRVARRRKEREGDRECPGQRQCRHHQAQGCVDERLTREHPAADIEADPQQREAGAQSPQPDSVGDDGITETQRGPLA